MHISESQKKIEKIFFATNPVFKKLIGDAFRTDYICSLSCHFLYWQSKSKIYSLSLDLIIHVRDVKNWSEKSLERSEQCNKNSFKEIERGWTYILIHWWPISPICLNEFLLHCLLRSMDFCDEFFTHGT